MSRKIIDELFAEHFVFKKFSLCILASLLTCGPAHSELLRFRLFEDSVDQFTPFVLTIETENRFQHGSKIKNIKLDLVSAGQTIPLFAWTDRQISRVISYSWDRQGNLVLKNANNKSSFKSIVQREVSNPWGDTSINPSDQYSIYIDGEIKLNRDGSRNENQFEISNDTVQESCLWGILKK